MKRDLCQLLFFLGTVLCITSTQSAYSAETPLNSFFIFQGDDDTDEPSINATENLSSLLSTLSK